MRIFFLFITLIIFLKVNAQDSEIKFLVSDKIIQKMNDSLALSKLQQNRIRAINIFLHEKKMVVRRQSQGNEDILTDQIQKIESTRDSLYKPVLSAEQFEVYRQKKRYLIGIN